MAVLSNITKLILAVGVTNRRDQQEARFIAFKVPFGQPLRTYTRFLTPYLQLALANSPRILELAILVLITTLRMRTG